MYVMKDIVLVYYEVYLTIFYCVIFDVCEHIGIIIIVLPVIN